MFQKVQRWVMAVGAVGAIAVGGAVVANAASQQGTRPPQQSKETPLTGETASKVEQAAKDKVPGGTILRVETDAGDAAYEAHVRKSDGTEVVVLVNKDFQVTGVQEFGPPGRTR